MGDCAIHADRDSWFAVCRKGSRHLKGRAAEVPRVGRVFHATCCGRQHEDFEGGPAHQVGELP
eukprot:230478-Lingulodinium_polyedra.AAC.1